MDELRDQSQNNLTSAPEWHRLVATWGEAEEIVSGARGMHPFNNEEKNRLMLDLEVAASDVAALETAALIGPQEAALLREDLQLLAERVRHHRPEEMMGVTCYMGLPVLNITLPERLERLSKRLPLLERLAASGTLRREVLFMVIDRDLDAVSLAETREQAPGPEAPKTGGLLADMKSRLGLAWFWLRLRRRLSDSDWRDFVEIFFRNAERRAIRDRRRLIARIRKTKPAAKAAERLKKIRAQLPSAAAGLEQSEDWQTIVTAWEHAVRLIGDGKGTAVELETAKSGLAAAADAVLQLGVRGLLCAAEADLLRSEARRLKQEVSAITASDERRVMTPGTPLARVACRRLSERLGYLERRVAGGDVRPIIWQKVADGIRAELKALSDEAWLQGAPHEARAEVERARRKMKIALAQIERLMGPAK